MIIRFISCWCGTNSGRCPQQLCGPEEIDLIRTLRFCQANGIYARQMGISQADADLLGKCSICVLCPSPPLGWPGPGPGPGTVFPVFGQEATPFITGLRMACAVRKAKIILGLCRLRSAKGVNEFWVLQSREVRKGFNNSMVGDAAQLRTAQGLVLTESTVFVSGS